MFGSGGLEAQQDLAAISSALRAYRPAQTVLQVETVSSVPLSVCMLLLPGLQVECPCEPASWLAARCRRPSRGRGRAACA